MAEEVKKTKSTTPKKTVKKVIAPTEKDKQAAKKAQKVKEAVNELIDALTSNSTIEVEVDDLKAKAAKIVDKKQAAKKSTTKKTTVAKESKQEEKPKSTTKKTITTKKVVQEEKPVVMEEPKVAKKASVSKTTKVESTQEKTKVVKEEKPKSTIKKPEVKKVKLSFDTSKLDKDIFFSKKVYEQAIFDTIIADRAALRQGTHDVKSRSEVSGSGKKPWRQKGTGRARAGSLRSPVFVGGGRAFGPTPERNYKLKVNKKVRKLAFKSALTLLAQDKAIVVNDLKLEKISTKELLNKLVALKVDNLRKILIVTNDETVYRSGKNLPNVAIYRPTSVSVESLINADVLVLSKEGLEIIEGRFK